MVIIISASSTSLSHRSANNRHEKKASVPTSSELRLEFLGEQGRKLDQLKTASLEAATRNAEMAWGEYQELLEKGKPKAARDGLLIAFCGSVSVLGRGSHRDFLYNPQLMTLDNIKLIASSIDPTVVDDRRTVLDLPLNPSEPDFVSLIRKLNDLSKELTGLVVTPAQMGSGYKPMEWAIHNNRQRYIREALEAIHQTLQIIRIACAPQTPSEPTKFNEFKVSNQLTVEKAHYWSMISSDDLELAQQLVTRDCSPRGVIPCVLRPIRNILFESTSLKYCCARAR